MSPVAAAFLKGQAVETPAWIQGINPHRLQPDIHSLWVSKLTKWETVDKGSHLHVFLKCIKNYPGRQQPTEEEKTILRENLQ